MTYEQITVALWRGYFSGCFYARPPEDDVAVAVSPPFRVFRLPWKEWTALHENPGAVDALRLLEGQLSDEGWQRTGPSRGGAWYERQFRRTTPVECAGATRPRPDRGVISPIHPSDPAPRPSPPRQDGGGLPENEIRDAIVEALHDTRLATSELCRRVGRHPSAVRAARRRLEAAGLVRRVPPPPGVSTRAAYWELVREHGRGGGTS